MKRSFCKLNQRRRSVHHSSSGKIFPRASKLWNGRKKKIKIQQGSSNMKKDANCMKHIQMLKLCPINVKATASTPSRIFAPLVTTREATAVIKTRSVLSQTFVPTTTHVHPTCSSISPAPTKRLVNQRTFIPITMVKK